MKNIIYFLFVMLLIATLTTSFTRASLLKDRIYYNFAEYDLAFCLRYLDKDNMVGCSSDYGGNVGEVYLVENLTQIQTFLNYQNSNKYIIVINFSLFVTITTDVMDKIRESPQTNGLLLMDDIQKNNQHEFSEDITCPGQTHSYYGNNQCSETTWNPIGKGYLTKNWPFPIVLIQNNITKNYEAIRTCHQLHNVDKVDFRRCSLELSTFMEAVQSAVVCIRRRDAMLRNIFLTESPTFCNNFTYVSNLFIYSGQRAPQADKEILLILTRLDARSMFNGRSFGVRSVLPNIAILISTISHLFALDEFRNASGTKQVVFGFLSNEAFDYMGSEKMAYLLSKKEFLPRDSASQGLDINSIKQVIEIGPIGSENYDNLDQIYAFTTPNASATDVVTKLKGLFTDPKFTLNDKSVNQLPPASIQSLFKRKNDLPSVFLTDANNKWTDSWFHSAVDKFPANGLNNSETALFKIVQPLVKYIYKYVTDKDLSKLTENNATFRPEEFVKCFAEDYFCDTFKNILGDDVNSLNVLPPPPMPTTSYWNGSQPTYTVGTVVQFLLINIIGVPKDVPEGKTCADFSAKDSYSMNSGDKAMGRNGSQCIQAPVIVDDNLHPGGYLDGDWYLTNSYAGSWLISSITETPTVRLFLKPNLFYEILFVSLGVLVTLITLLLSWCINKHKALLFQPIVVATPFIDD